MLNAHATIRTGRDAAGLLNLARRSSGVGRRGSCVGSEGFPERLRFLGRLLDGLGAVLPRYAPRHGASVAAPRLEVFREEFDEVGGEEADHAPVALQASHPPRAVAGVEAFDQVSFYEAEVAFGLECGQYGYA